jgi:hypothetical protein
MGGAAAGAALPWRRRRLCAALPLHPSTAQSFLCAAEAAAPPGDAAIVILFYRFICHSAIMLPSCPKGNEFEKLGLRI